VAGAGCAAKDVGPFGRAEEAIESKKPDRLLGKNATIERSGVIELSA
jgi:hypothetical protein